VTAGESRSEPGPSKSRRHRRARVNAQ
jgi:hypothetical protein